MKIFSYCKCLWWVMSQLRKNQGTIFWPDYRGSKIWRAVLTLGRHSLPKNAVVYGRILRCPHLIIDQVVRCLKYTRGNMKMIWKYTKIRLSGVTCSNDNNVPIDIAFRSVKTTRNSLYVAIKAICFTVCPNCFHYLDVISEAFCM
jgi:hypothetical protein